MGKTQPSLIHMLKRAWGSKSFTTIYFQPQNLGLHERRKIIVQKIGKNKLKRERKFDGSACMSNFSL